jgi:hypothetical protein
MKNYHKQNFIFNFKYFTMICQQLQQYSMKGF